MCFPAVAPAQEGRDYAVPDPTIGSFESLDNRSPLARWRRLLGRTHAATPGELAERESSLATDGPEAGTVPQSTADPLGGSRPMPAEALRFEHRPAGSPGRPLIAQIPGDERLPALEPQPELGPRREPVTDPTQLKKITEILPYADYEPDPEVRRDDPCLNLCPRPDDPLCKIYPEGRMPLCPDELLLGTEVWFPRVVEPSVFTWEASNLYHYPLYFEDPPLERYGHTYGCLVQPFVSVGRFNLQLLGLPYQMTIDPACRKIYTLGWYRPGECAPKLHYQIPWHHQAAINQALAVTGMFYLIP